jgi:hypothetical protein
LVGMIRSWVLFSGVTLLHKTIISFYSMRLAWNKSQSFFPRKFIWCALLCWYQSNPSCKVWRVTELNPMPDRFGLRSVFFADSKTPLSLTPRSPTMYRGKEGHPLWVIRRPYFFCDQRPGFILPPTARARLSEQTNIWLAALRIKEFF